MRRRTEVLIIGVAVLVAAAAGLIAGRATKDAPAAEPPAGATTSPRLVVAGSSADTTATTVLQGRLFVLKMPTGTDCVMLLDGAERMRLGVWPATAKLESWGIDLDDRQANFGPTLQAFGGRELTDGELASNGIGEEAQRCGADGVWQISSIAGPSA